MCTLTAPAYRCMNRSTGHHFDRADRALAHAQDQVTTVQQIFGAGHRVLRRHLAVIQVRSTLGDGPPSRRLARRDQP